MTGLTWWYTSRHHRVRFGWDTAYIKHILFVSLPYGLALFLNVIFFKVDVILLSIMEPRDIADSVIALYALPMKIVEVGMLYGTVFLNSLLPVLTDAITKDDTRKVKKLISRAFLLLFGGGIFASLISFLGADTILRIISSESFVTEQFYGATTVDAFRIVSWIFLVYFVSSLATYILIAQKAEKKMLIINAVIALINIIGNIILIPHYSFIGAAWATLASQVLLLALVSYAVRDTLWKRS